MRTCQAMLSCRRAWRCRFSPRPSRAVILSGLLLLAGGCRGSRPAPTTPPPVDPARCEWENGGIIRGDKTGRTIALAFTAHEFAEGGDTVLSELKKHRARASFFLTGHFIANPNFHPWLKRMARDGHYFSVHSDQHLLLCSWDRERRTLVSRDEFRADIEANFTRYEALKLKASPGRFFIPAYEHYNRQITTWAQELGCMIINYTPGTRSNADYTGEADKNFVSTQTIFDSIIKREQTDPHGLNGFILLLHLGSGPGRADKFHFRFGELLDYLTGKGYELVRVDELLAPPK